MITNVVICNTKEIECPSHKVVYKPWTTYCASYVLTEKCVSSNKSTVSVAIC